MIIMNLGIYGEVSELTVRIIMTETITEMLRKYDKYNKNPCSQLNKLSINEIDQIKFEWDRSTYRFKVSLRFTEPVGLFHAELLFRKVYLAMLKSFQDYCRSL